MRRLCTTCKVEPPDSEAIQQVPRTFYHSARSWPTYRREIPGDLSPTKWHRPPEPPHVWTALQQESLPKGHPSRGKPRICASIEEIPPGKSVTICRREAADESAHTTQRPVPLIANRIPDWNRRCRQCSAATHDGTRPGERSVGSACCCDLMRARMHQQIRVRAGAICAVRWRGRIFKQVTSMRIVPRMRLGPRQHYVAETAFAGGSGSIGMDARAQMACHAIPGEVKSARYTYARHRQPPSRVPHDGRRLFPARIPGTALMQADGASMRLHGCPKRIVDPKRCRPHNRRGALSSKSPRSRS
jgi:hypothetical protein